MAKNPLSSLGTLKCKQIAEATKLFSYFEERLPEKFKVVTKDALTSRHKGCQFSPQIALSSELPDIAMQKGTNTSEKGQCGDLFGIKSTSGNAEFPCLFERWRTLGTAVGVLAKESQMAKLFVAKVKAALRSQQPLTPVQQSLFVALKKFPQRIHLEIMAARALLFLCCQLLIARCILRGTT